jgi:hypothetical protein
MVENAGLDGEPQAHPGHRDGAEEDGHFPRYSDEKAPLPAYAELMGLYGLAFAVFLVVAKRSGRPLPERISPGDILLLGLATFKMSRLLTKEKVTGVLRAPFAVYHGTTGEGELSEEPRGEGMQRAIGELLTCPFCLGTWIAALLAYGLVLSPPVTRLVAAILSIRAVSDFLQLGYAAACHSVKKLEAEEA